MRKVRNDSKFSQECIIDAFIVVIAQKNFKDISVTEICKKAGVARITFYKYFKNMDELLKASVKNRLKGVKDKVLESNNPNRLRLFLEHCIELIISLNKSIVRIAKSNNSDIVLQEYTNSLIELLPIFETDPNLKKTKYVFLAGGSFNVIVSWITSGMKDDPKEVVEKLYAIVNQFVNIA